jgi:purine-cytosine permease-like protein
MTDSGQDAIGAVEQHGVDFIPLSERHSRPSNLGWVLTGQALTFVVILTGWLPIAYGLGWWSTVTAIIVGMAVGSAVLSPISLIGPRTGTNGPVSSGAYFGVVGRILGTAISLFIALGFGALAIWTSGQAAVEGAHRLFGLSDGDGVYAVAYAVIAAITILVACYGHASVVAVQKLMVPTVGLLLVVGVFTFAGDFDASYHGGSYLLGGFWATWVLAAVTVAALPLSLAPFLNDYARYIPPTTKSSRLVGATFAGSFLGIGLPLTFAAYTATAFKDPMTDYITGLIGASPTWYVVPIVVIGLLGGCGQAVFCLYGTGLDTSSLIPRLKRVPATLLLSSVAVALVYLGSFVWDATSTVSSFILLFTVMLMPWVSVLVVGHFSRRGRYLPDDLQVFNRGEKGGAYWFTGGINLRAFAAYVPSVVVGCLFLNTSLFTGPWANALNGIDLSFVSAFGLSAVIYGALVLIWPERIHGAPVTGGGHVEAVLAGTEPA